MTNLQLKLEQQQLEQEQENQQREQYLELYNFKDANFTFKQLYLELNHFFVTNSFKSKKECL